MGNSPAYERGGGIFHVFHLLAVGSSVALTAVYAVVFVILVVCSFKCSQS